MVTVNTYKSSACSVRSFETVNCAVGFVYILDNKVAVEIVDLPIDNFWVLVFKYEDTRRKKVELKI